MSTHALSHPISRIARRLGLAAALALGIACSKAPADEAPRPIAQAVAPAAAELGPDEIGALHNDALAYLDRSGVGADTEPATYDALLTEFLATRGIAPAPGDVDAARAQRFVETYLTGSPTAAVSKLHADGVLSDGQLRYLQAAARAMTDFSAPDALAQIERALASLERDAAADAGLPAAEQTAVLTALAIARHSAAYWHDQSVDTGPQALGLSAKCKKCLKANWGWIAFFDGLGGVAGGPLAWLTAPIVSLWAVFYVCPVCQ